MTGAERKMGKVFLMSGAIGIIVGAAISMYGRFSGYPVTVTSGFASGAGIAAALLVFDMKLGANEATRKVEDAERKAYEIDSESSDDIAIGRLFNLYSKQIEKYQQETRSRATWSFIFAILSMCAGMAFMFWGGQVVLSAGGANHVAAGAAISAIGGGISAYITKTFLDVHKLSLTQLNRYFTQPVINDHIVMAQRLAEDVKDDEVRKKSYEKIVSSVTSLIDSTNAELNKGRLK
ncbi:MAG: hypothetical protein WGN25_00855 [Candidatus Electrothrix sp. GW3-4]|uniref:TRADD-N-associated membrane domain-containing protein n=1 Tax=Candidatus Electrothrix sp. GW3-4 TaxID=3126740 RepID=UPI0030D277B0